jgi:hypothetical protein
MLLLDMVCLTVACPQPYFERCVFDACSCDFGGDCECLCTAISVYAQVETQRKGKAYVGGGGGRGRPP